ncbi:uncharacterized protein LOC119174188 [Rhipicephalus microplus]|uniref:uncharacterized protein LOC119174188 n=1 Tax=Rhipicephalus microplus TaxID=6941 RepID=UPI003F6CEF82
MYSAHISLALTLGTLLTTTNVFGKLGAPGGPQKLPYDAPDTFKIFETFRFAVSISDSDNDTVFECLQANRTAFNAEQKTATYVFIFPNTQEQIPFHVKYDDTPGIFTFTVDKDPTPRDGIFYYTDYVNCDVVDIEFRGHQCILWAQRSVKDNVPQDCIDHFVDICGVVVPEHSRDLCPDGEGDY